MIFFSQTHTFCLFIPWNYIVRFCRHSRGERNQCNLHALEILPEAVRWQSNYEFNRFISFSFPSSAASLNKCAQKKNSINAKDFVGKHVPEFGSLAAQMQPAASSRCRFFFFYFSCSHLIEKRFAFLRIATLTCAQESMNIKILLSEYFCCFYRTWFA